MPESLRTPARRPDVLGTAAGKRKAARRDRLRRPRIPALPPVQAVAGVAVLAVAGLGAVTMPAAPAADGTAQHGTTQDGTAPDGTLRHASALTGTSNVSSTSLLDEREQAVSRDSANDALEDASAKKVIKAAEDQAKERNAALAQFAKKAEQQAQEIARNKWVLPLSGYRLTATFGQSSGLWSRSHTGLDFAAPSGTPIRAIANGTITSTGYEGAYGNQTVQTLEDGTEVWYCHQTSFSVSQGEQVRAGEVIGTVGSTGNSTGPHLHLEIRPGAGDPVDPATALSVHGLRP